MDDDLKYLNSGEGRMIAVLVGGLCALQLRHERRAYFNLASAIEWRGDPDYFVVSCESQERAYQFVAKYGARTARRYARALLREIHARLGDATPLTR